MPTVELDRKTVERLMGKKLPTEKLMDRISMLGTDLEDVTDEKIIVEIFPNRPDMLSEGGFARALGTFIGAQKGLAAYTSKPSKYEVKIDPSVKDVRPFTACAVVTGLHFNDEKIREVIQLQEKLHTTFCRNRKKAAIGIYPMEKITWPITYHALPPAKVNFRPLESGKEMTGRQILEEHTAGRAYGHLLDAKKRFPLFTDAAGEVLSMPPIINSHRTGKVDVDTTDIFIETSGFDLASQKNLLNILVTAFADMGGTIHDVKVTYPGKYPVKTFTSPDLDPWRMPLDVDYINRLLGLDLSAKQIADLLGKMGFAVKGKDVLVPCYRADILHPMDIVEDVAIAYGYENFDPVIPNVATTGQAVPFSLFQEKVAALLAGLGLLETHTYHLSSESAQRAHIDLEKEFAEVEKSQGGEFSILRSWMLPSMLEVLQSNKRYEYPQGIYEMGNVFTLDKTRDTGVRESYHLSMLTTHGKVSYTDARQYLDALARHLDVEISMQAKEYDFFIPGRSAQVLIKGTSIGYLGEVHPAVLEGFGLELPVAAIEIDLNQLCELAEVLQ